MTRGRCDAILSRVTMVVRHREEWQRIRARGRRAFVLRYGVLGRGVPMALLCALAIEFTLGSPFPDALTSPAFLGRLAFAFVVFAIGGAFTATMTWRLYERRFGADAP